MAVRSTTKPRAKTASIAKLRKPAAKSARPLATVVRTMAATNAPTRGAAASKPPLDTVEKATPKSAAKPVAKARAAVTKVTRVTRTSRGTGKPKPKA